MALIGGGGTLPLSSSCRPPLAISGHTSTRILRLSASCRNCSNTSRITNRSPCTHAANIITNHEPLAIWVQSDPSQEAV